MKSCHVFGRIFTEQRPTTLQEQPMHPSRRHFIAVVISLLICHAGGIAGEAPILPARILFIGNSYTGVNNLPVICKEIIASAGITVPEIKSATPGGRTLEKHLGEPGSLKLIDEGKWDVVILQGQSQEASMAEVNETIRAQFLAGAHGLCQRVLATSPKARIIFYQTWARHADYWKEAKAETSVGKDPADMQARNRTWYQRAAAQDAGSIVAPVGDAWELHYKDPAAVRLHSKDNSHPAFNGSYLAGLVIYGAIYRPANLAVPWRGKLTDKEAAHLQQLAGEVLKLPRK
jgi:hypothetical protein